MENNVPKPIPILYDTDMAVINNSVGTKMFRNFYAYIDGQRKDIVNGGELACGYFVSFVLHNFSLLGKPHLTVDGTEKDLQKSLWQEIDQGQLKGGCVLIWGRQDFGGDGHKHIGFYLGDNRAVSTDSQKGIVAEHHFTFNNNRPIEKAYWIEKLAQGTL